MEEKKSKTKDSYFSRAILEVIRSTREQEILERTLGKALLQKLKGEHGDLMDIYSKTGGNDRLVAIVLSEAQEQLDRLDLQKSKVSDGIRKTLLGIDIGDVTVNCLKASGVDERTNPLFKLEGSVLNTLADIGGNEFTEKYLS